MTGKGWVTGEDVRSRPYTHISQEDWDAIFKKKVPAASLVRPCFVDMFEGSPEYLERTKVKWIEENGNRP